MFEKKRYKLMFWIIKNLTPNFYLKLKNLSLTGDIWLPYNNFISKIPRPSILFMKDYFNNKAIKGVEIGVFRGSNSKSILKELNIKMLYLIDIWKETKGYAESYYHHGESYKKVIKELGNYNNIKIIKNFSKIASKYVPFIDFVYIDGDHSYKGVYEDLKTWYPKIKNKGIIAGHDILNIRDVLLAVSDFCREKKINFKIKKPDWYFIKNI